MECHQEKILAPSCSNSLDDLFSAQNMEVDVGMEWLSVFVEDCFSSPPSCVLVPSGVENNKSSSTIISSGGTVLKRRSSTTSQHVVESPLQNFVVPGKARSKRKRLSAPRRKDHPLSIWSHTLNPQNEALSTALDPPLLKQSYWLADSEILNIVSKEKKGNDDDDEKKEVVDGEKIKEEMINVREKENSRFEDCDDEVNNNNINNNGQQNTIIARRCTHCLSQRTPQWRAGPLGPKTLCNACGVRYKSGRLLPEYRPAKSPTFVSFLHSNSHKKVMEMRMTTVPSSIPSSE